MKKKTVCMFLIVSMLLPLLIVNVSANIGDVVAYPVDGGNIYFDKTTGKIVDSDDIITGVILPIEIDGVAVSGIGYKAFDWCHCLESAVIPSSVQSIDEMAFIHCNRLADLIISDGVQRIEESAFEYCTSLVNISIPKSVTYIGYRAFADCRSMTGASISGNNTVIEDEAFIDCYSLDTVVMSHGVTFDMPEAFKYCWSLKGVLFTYDAPVAMFDDVFENDWYYNAVCFVTNKHLFNGVGNNLFSPNSLMTRAMFLTVLWRLCGRPDANKAEFDDVSGDMWYSKAVGWAQECNLVKGVGHNKFSPDAAITREQFAVILMRYSCMENDYNAMDWAVDAGLIRGSLINGVRYLNPDGFATRAQVAEVLMRYYGRD